MNDDATAAARRRRDDRRGRAGPAARRELRGRLGQGRRRCRHRTAHAAVRPGAARPRRAAPRRPRGAAFAARPQAAHAGVDRHGARFGAAAHRGPGCRRRRLRAEALRPRRASGAHPGLAAPRIGAGRAGLRASGCQHQSVDARSRRGRPAGGAVGARMGGARTADRTAGHGALARAARRKALRLEGRDQQQRGRGLCARAAQEARRRSHSQCAGVGYMVPKE